MISVTDITDITNFNIIVKIYINIIGVNSGAVSIHHPVSVHTGEFFPGVLMLTRTPEKISTQKALDTSQKIGV